METSRYVAPNKLPTTGDLCADIRDGLTTADLAAMYEVGETWIRTKIRDAGWDPDTGRAPERPQRAMLAAALGQDQEWAKDALCAQTDPEAFFPEKGGTTAPGKSLCRRCPVRAECLDYALEHDERFGIWGGLSERERRQLKKTATSTTTQEKP